MQTAARFPLAVAIAGLVLAVASGVSAQAPGIPDEAVKRILDLALRNIHRATCDGFNDCAPATAFELEYPPLTLDQARAAMIAGTRTAIASWCGLDAERRSVLPMTKNLRKLRFNERQIALSAVIHGIQQSTVLEQLKARGACDEDTRSKMDAQLPKA
jgi:hypothetical protein